MTASDDSGKRGERRGGGFRRAGDMARAPLAQAAAGRGFAETDVLLRWPEVVGEALAGSCRPVKVSYGRSRALGATLIVEVEGARGPEVEMSAPRIVERVNGFYGYRAVSRLKVTQAAGTAGQAGGPARARPPFAGPVAEPQPGAAASQQAGEMAGAAENPELRAALARLGAYVLSQPRRPA